MKTIRSLRNFKFDKIKNILNAETNVKFEDTEKNTTIFSGGNLFKKRRKILQEGNSKAVNENNTILHLILNLIKLKIY